MASIAVFVVLAFLLESIQAAGAPLSLLRIAGLPNFRLESNEQIQQDSRVKPNAPELMEYLDPGPFRFDMRFGQCLTADYFAETIEHDRVVSERAEILAAHPERHSALLPEGEPLLQEMAASIAPAVCKRDSPPALEEIGRALEPDFLLLKREADGPRLVGGCVCFPSSWDLREKIGRRMAEIHSVVPGLNQALGRQIDGFLDRIKPVRAWTRTNWGLSRSPSLNQHPDLTLPRLDGSATLEESFFRVEEQALSVLPQSGGILFGIRIRVFPLASFEGEAAARLALKLRTMPEAVARYKGLGSARERIAALLEEK